MNFQPWCTLQSQFILKCSDNEVSGYPSGAGRPRSNISIEPSRKPPIEDGEFSAVTDPLQDAAGSGNPQERTAAVDMRGVQVVNVAEPVGTWRFGLERTLNQGIRVNAPDDFAPVSLGGIDRQSE